MPKFRYIDELLREESAPCAYPGCAEAGEYRAPVSPDLPGQYQYFCLDHVKAFNKSWNYFGNRGQSEIEAFQRDAFTGHRPTWKMHPGTREHATQRLREAFTTFMGRRADFPMRDYTPPVPLKDRQALEVLGLEHPVDETGIKQQYKTLVKRHHPDRNPEDKQAEERFKKISAAYRHLIEHYCPTITGA